MKPMLMIGLGNPGRQYVHTRHNIGYRVIEALHSMLPDAAPWHLDKNLLISKANYNGKNLLLIKPQTLMNECGIPISRHVTYHKIPLAGLWIVHDELDLPFGEIREAFDRGAAGHKGVESIIANLGTQAFHRLRFGIGTNRESGIPAEEYVLQKFTQEQERQLEGTDGVIHHATALLQSKIVTE
jgi:PTH1 family peptidyl-tRNA hydrolase